MNDNLLYSGEVSRVNNILVKLPSLEKQQTQSNAPNCRECGIPMEHQKLLKGASLSNFFNKNFVQSSSVGMNMIRRKARKTRIGDFWVCPKCKGFFPKN